MICQAMVPNYLNLTNNSIYPSPKTNLSFSATISQGRRPVSTFLSRQSLSLSDFRPYAAARGGGAIGELPATAENFYELLGIPVSGSHDDIKRAYKQLARKYHPDVSPPDRVEEYTHRFILVQEAYETLSDPEFRALYDRCLVRGLHFAFSARRQFDEELEKKFRWKNRWQDQLLDLKRRGAIKNSDDNLSWGARMRRRMAESSAD